MTDSARLYGIDVSNHQNLIDWDAIASGGYSFCFIKASEGGDYVDVRVEHNLSQARRIGLPRGAYHFFRPRTAVQAQVQLFTKLIWKREPGDLPPVLDLEVPGDWQNIPAQQRAALAVEWLTAVEAKLNVKPIVYMSPSFVTDVLQNELSGLENYPLWIANYRDPSTSPIIPKGWQNWTFWQYSNSGHVSGIGGNTDLDLFNGTESDLKALLF